jgi:hypothetical protein
MLDAIARQLRSKREHMKDSESEEIATVAKNGFQKANSQHNTIDEDEDSAVTVTGSEADFYDM